MRVAVLLMIDAEIVSIIDHNQPEPTMFARSFLSIALATSALTGAAFAEEKPAKPTPAAVELEPLFNGKDLTGWDAGADNPFWSVKEGVLVGASDEKLRGHVLNTSKTFTDCIVEVEFRFNGEIDSGVYLRKPIIQAQIGVSRSLKKDMTGSFYVRGKYPKEAEGVAKLLKVGDWNTMRVEARGPKFEVFLNGQHVLSYEDAEVAGAGPIGLQIHAGLKMAIEFKSIKAKAL